MSFRAISSSPLIPLSHTSWSNSYGHLLCSIQYKKHPHFCLEYYLPRTKYNFTQKYQDGSPLRIISWQARNKWLGDLGKLEYLPEKKGVKDSPGLINTRFVLRYIYCNFVNLWGLWHHTKYHNCFVRLRVKNWPDTSSRVFADCKMHSFSFTNWVLVHRIPILRSVLIFIVMHNASLIFY